jgi:predicted ATP-grasp superfamily ATP-dependent carboligase
VVGIAGDPRHPCCRTNACTRVLTTDVGGSGLIETLAVLGHESDRRAVLFPCTDLSVLLLSRWREQLHPWFHIVLPPASVVEMLVDKGRFYAYAQREALPIPPTFFLRDRADVERAARALRFPCILKPTLKSREWRRHSSVKAYKVGSREELFALYERCSGWGVLLIAQDWIEGDDDQNYTCNAYFGAGSEPLVTFTSRKLRQWPPTGGEGCLSQESRNDTVERETVRLFQRAGHRGLGYLEMKRDARTGDHLIIEPNVGRPTGRSACAEAAGVELLYTMYCDVLERPLPAARQQRYRGVKWTHSRRDLQAALYHWRRGELTVHDWLRSRRGPKVDALFSWRDPVPFWADAGRAFLDVALSRKTRRAGQPSAEAATA